MPDSDPLSVRKDHIPVHIRVSDKPVSPNSFSRAYAQPGEHPKESLVLEMLISGHKVTDIAKRLHIADKTVSRIRKQYLSAKNNSQGA